jgi:hypothetical protein
VIVVGVLAPGADGARAVAIARAAAGTVSGMAGMPGTPGTPGTRPGVELLGVTPPSAAGDASLIELASAGIGHATVIRSDATAIEPADLELALRYLPDVRAIVLVRPEAPLLSAAASAATWSGAGLVVVGPLTDAAGAVVDAAALLPIVLEPPERDPDDTFAGFVGALAARLDAGEPADAAWRSTLAGLAVDRVGEG